MNPTLSLPAVYAVEDGPFKGGMGCVYRVRHLEWDTLLAVKQPLPGMLQNERACELFLHECELWVLLGMHEHIVLCHYVRSIQGVPTVFAEWMPGGDLRALIASGELYRGLETDPVSVQLRLIDLGVQIARGMVYAHSRGLVHRDLKPANILFAEDGTAKVTDFGLAVLRGGGEAQKSAFGTAAYAPPEQQRGGPAGPAADLWSFGVVLLELFLGGRFWKNSLFVPAGLRTWLTQSRVPVPQEVSRLIRLCCVPDPLRRLADFAPAEKILTGCWRRLAGTDYPRKEAGETGLIAASWNNRALSYLDLGREDRAKECWEKALRCDPGHMPSLYNRTLYLWRGAGLDDLGAGRILQNAYNNDPRPENAELLAKFLLERQSTELLKRLSLPDGMETSVRLSLPDAGAVEGDVPLTGCRAADRDPLPDPREGLQDDQRRLIMAKTARFLRVRGDEAAFFFADRTAELWDIRRSALICTLSTEGAVIQDALFAPDGSVCAAAAEGVIRFDRSGRRISFFPVAEGSVRHICLCGDKSSLMIHAGRREGSTGKEYMIRVSLGTGERLSKVRFTGIHPGILLMMRGGREIVVAAGNRLLRVDPSAGKLLQQYTGGAAPFECAAVQEEKGLIAACSDGRVRIWRTKDGREQSCFPVGSCHSLDFIRDGEYLITAGDDPQVRLWEISGGRCLRSFLGHRGGVRSICAEENGQAFYSAGEYDGVFYQHVPAFRYRAVWKLCRAEETSRLQKEDQRFRSLVLSAAAHWKKGEKVQALQALYRAREVPGYARHPAYLRLNAAMGRSLRVRSLLGIWNRGTDAEENALLSPPQAADPCAGTDAAGKVVLRAQFDGEVRLSEDGKTKRLLRCGRRGLSSAALSGDGHCAALGFHDGEIRLIKTEERSLCWKRSNESMVTRLCFAPSDTLLTAGLASGTILIYDLSDGRVLHLLTGHTAPVTGLRFSADGRMLRSDSEDGGTQLWQLDYEYAPEGEGSSDKDKN